MGKHEVSIGLEHRLGVLPGEARNPSHEESSLRLTLLWRCGHRRSPRTRIQADLARGRTREALGGSFPAS
jgi:hypothetical protein